MGRIGVRKPPQTTFYIIKIGFGVVCGGLGWFAVVLGGLRWFAVIRRALLDHVLKFNLSQASFIVSPFK